MVIFLFLLQFELVCDREWMLPQAQTLAIIGMITGAFISGWTADRFVYL